MGYVAADHSSTNLQTPPTPPLLMVLWLLLVERLELRVEVFTTLLLLIILMLLCGCTLLKDAGSGCGDGALETNIGSCCLGPEGVFKLLLPLLSSFPPPAPGVAVCCLDEEGRERGVVGPRDCCRVGFLSPLSAAFIVSSAAAKRGVMLGLAAALC